MGVDELKGDVVRTWVAVLAVAAAALTACDSKSGDPATPTDATGAVFNPCQDVPDSAVASFADPATKQKDIAGVHQAGMEVCAWDGPAGSNTWYSVTVFAHSKSVDEAKRSPRFVDARFEATSIGGVSGELNKRSSKQGYPEDCAFVFAAPSGAVVVEASVDGGQLVDQELRGVAVKDPCPVLEASVAAIAPHVPK